MTEHRHNSHSDVIVGRLVEGYLLNGTGEFPRLKLMSLYTDQVPQRDTSRTLAKQHGLRIGKSVRDALTLGTGKLAVDGVLLVAEHGKYPRSATGQVVYPKRRLFGEIVQVFEESGRVVPVFSDKHLADNWKDAKWIYDTARRMKIPLMAGSSLPSLWRYPPADVKRGAQIRQLVAVSYGRLDSYGFHGLEMVQSLLERRGGGETGVKSVECIAGEDVWKAAERGVYDPKLLQAALSRLKRPLRKGKALKQLVKNPVLFVVDYRDGVRACTFTLNGAVAEWAVAWAEDGRIRSTLFWVQDARPYMHFTYLVKGVEQMMHAGKPTWPVERTLLTSGILDALLISKKNGKPLATPWLDVRYKSTWNWQQPPPPPADRPSRGR